MSHTLQVTILKRIDLRFAVRGSVDRAGYEERIHGGLMSNHALIWAAVPHNSDGVVFSVRIARGLQRFHISRRVLEEVFELERHTTDARQLELFYACVSRILAKATAKRSIASRDTLALQISDFIASSREQGRWESHASARGAM
jgi:hypothetical protein